MDRTSENLLGQIGGDTKFAPMFGWLAWVLGGCTAVFLLTGALAQERVLFYIAGGAALGAALAWGTAASSHDRTLVYPDRLEMRTRTGPAGVITRESITTIVVRQKNDESSPFVELVLRDDRRVAVLGAGRHTGAKNVPGYGAQRSAAELGRRLDIWLADAHYR